MRKKVLFDYAERYTERGDHYYTRIAAALRPIYMEAEEDNVKLREVSHAIVLTSSMLEVEAIMARNVTKLKERWGSGEGVGAGIVPPSSPRILGGGSGGGKH